MPQNYYPVALDLQERPCLVVGGGKIAEEKIEPLLRSGADVTVISPDVRPHVQALADSGEIRLVRRSYIPGDIDPFYLVIAATDDITANAEISVEARRAGIIVNAVDDPPNCDFFAVSIVRRRNLQVAISTNGLSPAFARWMREHLDESLPGELGDLLDVLGDVRADLKANGAIPAYEYWKAAIDDQALDDVRHGRADDVRERLRHRLTTPEALASASSFARGPGGD